LMGRRQRRVGGEEEVVTGFGREMEELKDTSQSTKRRKESCSDGFGGCRPRRLQSGMYRSITDGQILLLVGEGETGKTDEKSRFKVMKRSLIECYRRVR